MKSMLISIAIMGGFAESKPFWGALLNSVQGPTDLLVIDNGAYDPPEDDLHNPEYCLNRFLVPFWPGEVFYHPQNDNLGVVKSLQYTYENFQHDILAFLHNDVYIYKRGWDTEVKNLFECESMAGLVGFFGAEGIHPSGGRFLVRSNMLEAEVHGDRKRDGYMRVAVLDGLSMFASREMLAQRDGVDMSFEIHHFYDLDLSLESLDRGYHNFALFTPIHHQSGLTACRPMFNNWANDLLNMEKAQDAIYLANEKRWQKKWADKLRQPYHVNMPWPA